MAMRPGAHLMVVTMGTGLPDSVRRIVIGSISISFSRKDLPAVVAPGLVPLCDCECVRQARVDESEDGGRATPSSAATCGIFGAGGALRWVAAHRQKVAT